VAAMTKPKLGKITSASVINAVMYLMLFFKRTFFTMYMDVAALIRGTRRNGLKQVFHGFLICILKPVTDTARFMVIFRK
jgi:hypothetical protein